MAHAEGSPCTGARCVKRCSTEQRSFLPWELWLLQESCFVNKVKALLLQEGRIRPHQAAVLDISNTGLFKKSFPSNGFIHLPREAQGSRSPYYRFFDKHSIHTLGSDYLIHIG